MSFSFGALVGAAHAVLEGLAALLTPAAGGLAAALAVVLLTAAVRLAISPLSYLQARATRRRAALAPDIEKLRAKHADDPTAFLAESMALHRAAGAGTLVTVLPALAQAPFFMLMYRVSVSGVGGSLAGVPLAAHLAQGLPIFAVLMAVTAALAWWSARRMRSATPGTSAAPSGPSAPAAPAGLTRAMSLLPFLTVGAVAVLPLAGALYLTTSTAWTALETAVLRRRPASSA
ncbi:membrane protein insertase YidC [Mangrovihabitans endophyticus]|uniref:Membrane protein insertase YidC n=1 Tax=Mangrovihabitans endophyticus TaxID=1751298 RepID=A0A8J3C5L9_9ACTN|nr:membrane protein insertase YidC [Mangrovihabitans endophyticus]GGL18417.1 protein translocase component YidC [Mangrovihabitans endophyticus]